jgi:DNA-binding NtrC family response regulator
VLLDHFLARFAAHAGKPVPSVAPDVRDALMRYDWPGNVRELENLCERLVLTQGRRVLEPTCIPSYMLSEDARPHVAAIASPMAVGQALPSSTALPVSLDERLRELERSWILWALRATGGNKSKAAHLLSIKRSTLSDRINRCDLNTACRTERPTAFRVSA